MSLTLLLGHISAKKPLLRPRGMSWGGHEVGLPPLHDSQYAIQLGVYVGQTPQDELSCGALQGATAGFIDAGASLVAPQLLQC